MKRILSILLIAVLLFVCTACANTKNDNQNTKEPDTPSTENVENETSDTSSEETSDTPNQLSSFSVFTPNDNADGFIVETVSIEDISAEKVLNELKKRNVLPETVAINSFNIDNNSIKIDFNQAYATLVCSMGTSGEAMVIGSTVNTFLDAFKAETVYFTIDGQVLESGHVIYDFAIGMSPLPQQPAN